MREILERHSISPHPGPLPEGEGEEPRTGWSLLRRRALGRNGECGFTLIEVIVTLIVASLLAAMLVELTGTNLTSSVQPVLNTQHAYQLNQVMENMTADYNNIMATNATPLSVFKTRVQNNTGNYGTYTLEENAYVDYDASGNQSYTGTKILKVTVSRGNVRLTTLFTE